MLGTGQVFVSQVLIQSRLAHPNVLNYQTTGAASQREGRQGWGWREEREMKEKEAVTFLLQDWRLLFLDLIIPACLGHTRL